MSQSISTNKQNIVEEIQLFRGVAALLVVLYHLTGLLSVKFGYRFLNSFFDFGFSGVDMFFVISGFIILYVHESDIGNRTKLLSFIKKRTIRIYPLYWLITLTILPVYFFVPTYGVGFETQFKDIIFSLLLLPQDHLPILAVGWSLTCELIFYSVFCFAIVSSMRFAFIFGISWILLTTCIIFIIYPDWFVNSPLGFKFLGSWRVYLFNRYNIEFFLGCLIVYIVKTRAIESLRVWVFWIGLIWFLLAGINKENLFNWFGPAQKFIGYGIPSFLLILGAQWLNRFNYTFIYKLFYLLGESSYSIYLTHTLLFSICSKLMMKWNIVPQISGAIAFVSLLFTALFIGYWISKLIERPMVYYLRHLLIKVPVKSI